MTTNEEKQSLSVIEPSDELTPASMDQIKGGKSVEPIDPVNNCCTKNSACNIN